MGREQEQLAAAQALSTSPGNGRHTPACRLAARAWRENLRTKAMFLQRAAVYRCCGLTQAHCLLRADSTSMQANEVAAW